ncbi:surface lipoprotein assembly modifier [Pelomicrobium sp. G1]|uniref:surface lipoprotein assembly modifier n=1 Tax=unclassified Pelomicrobium TaxID=2815318 RepID=UPI003F7726C8
MPWPRWLLIAWLWAATGSWAANITLELSHEEASALAAQWLAEGRTEDAGRLIERLAATLPGDPQIVFLQGLHALQTGRYRQAVERFRSLLTRDPRLIRVRLELARALYFAGDFEAARYHFEAALGEDLPPAARENVLRFLRAIEAQTTWIRFTATLIRDTNPANATRAERITLFGLEFVVDPQSRPRDSLGVGFNADARYAFGSENRSFVRGAVAAREYPGRFADFYYAQATLGRNAFLGDSVVSAEAGPVYARYQGRGLYAGGIAQASHSHPLGRRVLAQESLTWRLLDYDRFEDLSGHQPWAGLHLRYALDGTSALGASVQVGRHYAREEAFSYKAMEGVLRYSKELPARLNFEARLTANRFRYLGEQPLFGILRKDRLWRLDFEFLIRDWAVAGFAPYVAVSFERNDSTIPIHEYRRNFVAVGVSRAF